MITTNPCVNAEWKNDATPPDVDPGFPQQAKGSSL